MTSKPNPVERPNDTDDLRADTSDVGTELDGEGERVSRAWVTRADGTRTPVPAEQIQGLDEFAASWRNNVPEPEDMSFEGWQQVDDAHPANAGAPAYRVVFKTIRVATFPAVEFVAANLRVRLFNGPVNRGEPRFVGALAEAAPGRYLKPEWGRFESLPTGEPGYTVDIDMNISVAAHEETTASGNVVEVLYAVAPETGDDFAAVLAAGRAGVAPLLTSLELQFGARLLGPMLTEEVGELFDDGHWSRRLGGRRIRLESQASMELVPGELAAQFLELMLHSQLQRYEEQRRRTRIASQWFRHAQAQGDSTTRYISYWLVLEALELDENADIAPLKRAIAALLGVDVNQIAARLGRLYGTRSKLVHGKQRAVDAADIDAVKSVATALLQSHLLGRVNTDALAQLRQALAG